MKRRGAVKSILGIGAIGSLGTLSGLSSFASALPEQDGLIPVLFVGHGNPYNAIQKNEFNQKWKEVANNLPKPKAILCISAHWLTKGTYITAMERPKTIHDFSGFSEDLFNVEYPAPGDPDLARETSQLVKYAEVKLDENWGLDHGAWSVIMQMYPEADIPVLQFSIDYHKPGQYHYSLGKELSSLRKKGVLIIGSGNMVHNLRKAGLPPGTEMTTESMNREYGFDWAIESNEIFKSKILAGDHKSLIEYRKLGNAVNRSVPTPDHYFPMLYSLSLQGEKEKTTFFNDKCVTGSISMTSFLIA